MSRLRLLIHPPASGTWNMAVDEALLHTAAATGQGTLRFYQWSEPTVSLGYFQKHADRQQHVASLMCPLVRRTTGGGAIVHDWELTYSLTLPTPAPHRLDTAQLYDSVHSSLVIALHDLGVNAALVDKSTSRRVRPEPWLCFHRSAEGDVDAITHQPMGYRKIGGSAQRRSRGAVLQHGSVLLAASSAAPELPGVFELTGRQVATAELVAGWSCRLAEALEFELVAGQLSSEETAWAEACEKAKFADPAWTLRR